MNISYIASRRGWPTIRSKEIENEIRFRIAGGEALRHICLDPKMPCRDTVFRWLRADHARCQIRQALCGLSARRQATETKVNASRARVRACARNGRKKAVLIGPVNWSR